MKNQNDKISEKICVITGANSGIGKETAINLAKMGMHIIMICRNKERGEQAKEEIIRKSNNDLIDLLIADLASLKSVVSVSDQIIKNYDRIDILINNAGLFKMKREESEDGYELVFAVDYLSHFLLTIKLLDLIKKSAPSRIINVSSNIHYYFGLNKQDIMLEKKYNSQKAYGNAKSAQVLFTHELARRLEGTSVDVNALHPGEARTKMTTDGLPKFFVWITSKLPFFKSPEEAAECSTYVASSPDISGLSGLYFKNNKPVKSGKKTYDIELQSWLWEKSEELVKEFL